MTLKYYAERTAIINSCIKLAREGYVVGTYGNVSVRVNEGLLITPSRLDYNLMTPEDLVIVSLEGEVVEGFRFPSSEMGVHRHIMRRRPDVNAVVHTHSLYGSALACAHQNIPVILEEQAHIIGEEVRCTSYIPGGEHDGLGEEAARVLGGSNAILLANHGTVSCGSNLEDALFACLVVERVAHMLLLTNSAFPVVPIPSALVTTERNRYLNKYGRAEDWKK